MPRSRRNSDDDSESTIAIPSEVSMDSLTAAESKDPSTAGESKDTSTAGIGKEQDEKSEAECDLVLVDKQAWLAAKSMKMAIQEESSDYDSDDTVIKKSKLDAARANSNRNLSIINEEMSTDVEMKVIERASLHKSSNSTSLKQDDKNAQDVSMGECQVDIPHEESDTNGMEISQERRSLSKSRNQDTTEERSEKKKKKKSLSNRDDSKIEEQACLNRSTEKELKAFANLLENVFDDESSDSETIIPAMELGFENCSMVTRAGSIAIDSDGSGKLNDTSTTSHSNIVSSFLFAEVDNDEDNDNGTDKDSSVNSDVRKEYNLDGTEQKFDDDNVPHDECRASESEYSDPNDNGSDLIDFIVNDDKVENEEKEEEEDEEQEKNYEEQEEMNDEDNQTEEEDTIFLLNCEIGEEEKRVDTKNKDREKTRAKVNEYTMIENEDADDEHSEVEIHPCDNIDESSDDNNQLPEKIGENKKNDSVEIISSRNSETKKEQITDPKKSCATKNEETILLDTSDPNVSVFDKSKKTHVAKREETISLISSESPSSIKRKRKSLLRCSGKDGREQDSLKLDESAKSRFSRKLSRLHSPMDCSTPKLNSSKQLEFNIETPKTVEKTQESKVELDKSQTSTSSKKSKSKDSTTKKNTSLTDTFHQDKRFVERPLNSSLPSDLIEIIEKANSSKPTTVSKSAELRKSMSLTHTETPRIRHLRKEKLNESAPASKLHVEADQSKESKDELLTTEEKEDVAKTKIKKKSKENVPNVDSSRDITRKRKRQQAEETFKENITDKVLSEDTMELKASPKQKRVKFSESLTVKDDICKGTSEINETKKEKKTKKKLVSVSGQCENIKEAESYQNENVPNLEPSSDNITRKRKRQRKQAEETLKENITDKVLSEDTMELEASPKQKRVKFSESLTVKDDICKGTSEINETKKEKKKKKKLVNVSEQCENVKETDTYQNENVPNLESSSDNTARKRKRQRKHKRQAEETLDKHIIDRAFKKRRFLSHERRRFFSYERPMASPQPHNSKSKSAKNIGVQPNTSGSTTQFNVINLQTL
ncbi:hypothetical protein DMN91_009477 [Ooceraea biroi]|uniref:Uncharacterized protein n=1 Tax=Ooceraea biroi TaxID=2015173 RepID=A0A3L8DGS2_OOCBI|nr:hypothetical protein DMN91_009477 [Ooceraea biroi]